jgi:cysteine desulfurase family protein
LVYLACVTWNIVEAEAKPPGEVYMDNAATSWPKPPAVMEAMASYQENIGASAGRGGYRRAVEASRLIFDARETVARLFGVADSRRVIFTLNCTEGLNVALWGWLNEGDHVVATSMEHNSVARPLNHLKRERGIDVTYVACSPEGLLDPDDVARAITARTRLVAVVHASNVCGAVNDVAAVGAACRERGVPFLVDAAQSAGAVPINVDEMNVDFLAFPGHKGLMGPLGTGVLYVGPNVKPRPLYQGGTGTHSELTFQPDYLPDLYEAGSHNALGLAGLKAACEFVAEATPAALGAHKARLTERFVAAVDEIPGVTYYGPRDFTRHAGVCSVRVAGADPALVGHVLDAEYDIMVRTGLHCSPLAHTTLGTVDTGTVRFSFGYYNDEEQVDFAARALAEVARVGGR